MPSPLRFSPLAFVTALLLMSTTGHAGGSLVARSSQDGPTFASHAELVVLHVTVKDRRGSYVTDLTEDAFTVFDEGHLQRISAFSAADSPVTVGLIVDSSGSMREGRDRVVASVGAFAASSHPQDDLFALTFNESVRSVLPETGPFTSDPALLEAALRSGIRAYGRTALYDAVARGLEYVSRGRHPRRVLIVVADGGDNASKTTFGSVLRQAQASNAAIYAVGVVDPLDRTADRGRLRELARATGGEAFFPRRVDDLGAVLQRIAEEIRHTYTLGFVPPDNGRSDVFRRLRVEVRTPGRRGLTIRTREGYRGGIAVSRNG